MTIVCNVRGTKEEFDKLFLAANVRFGEYNNGKYRIEIRVPDFNDRLPTNRFYRLTTINGLYNKLRKKGYLISQMRNKPCI